MAKITEFLLALVCMLALIMLALIVFAVLTQDNVNWDVCAFWFVFSIAVFVFSSRKLRNVAKNVEEVPPESGLIDSYRVAYRGGLPEYREEKAGAIDFKVYVDRFEFIPTMGTKSWFIRLTIPYSNVCELSIAQRTVGTVEGILGGLNSRQLNQANNLHLSFLNAGGLQLVLRLEMLSGITVMGQAKKCQALKDRLKTHRLIENFKQSPLDKVEGDFQLDIISQIEKLASLHGRGILSEDEFNSKKTELLSRI